MKMRSMLAASAALALVAAAGSASAAITVVAPQEANNLNGALQYGMSYLDDFDGILSPDVSYVGNVITYQDPVVNSAAPPWTGGVSICCQGAVNYVADNTKFASVLGNSSGTFTALNGTYLTSFSFYMGSPDTYNKLTFNLVGGGTQVFTGSDIWGGPSVYPGGGDRNLGYRIYYDFGGAKVSSIKFESSQNSFEFDGLAGTLAVPEPGTWALMIMGFGGAGAMLRSRRRALSAA